MPGDREDISFAGAAPDENLTGDDLTPEFTLDELLAELKPYFTAETLRESDLTVEAIAARYGVSTNRAREQMDRIGKQAGWQVLTVRDGSRRIKVLRKVTG